MIELSTQNELLLIWVAFAVLALGGITAVLVWAVRARQFSDQDRARYLPLDADKPWDGDARQTDGTRAEGGGKHVST